MTDKMMERYGFAISDEDDRMDTGIKTPRNYEEEGKSVTSEDNCADDEWVIPEGYGTGRSISGIPPEEIVKVMEGLDLSYEGESVGEHCCLA